VNALGIAGSQASGSMEFLAQGAWTKRFHPGWAACAGLHAAALASAGFQAPSTIFEGRFGTLAGYSAGADARALEPGDGVELLRTSIKPHACCRYMQAPIDATLALCGEHHILAADVDRVEVGIVAAGFPIVCEPVEQKRRPTSVVDAQFSLPFGIAVAIARGSASPDDFTPAVFGDAKVVDLMARVTAVRDPALDAQYPRVWPAWVRITCTDGRRHDAALSHPRGDPESFPTRDELLGKFRRLAGRTLPATKVDTLAALVADVRRLDDVTRLTDATRPAGI
jgi:2-methylcitrate dehydratase PrpD